MSEFAVLIPGEDDTTTFDAETMQQQLPVRWPGSEVFPSPNFEGDSAVFHANVATSPYDITIYLDEDRQTIGIEPSQPREASEFVAWALSHLEGEPDAITVYGPDFARELTITPRTSAQEMEAFLQGTAQA